MEAMELIVGSNRCEATFCLFSFDSSLLWKLRAVFCSVYLCTVILCTHSLSSIWSASSRSRRPCPTSFDPVFCLKTLCSSAFASQLARSFSFSLSIPFGSGDSSSCLWENTVRLRLCSAHFGHVQRGLRLHIGRVFLCVLCEDLCRIEFALFRVEWMNAELETMHSTWRHPFFVAPFDSFFRWQTHFIHWVQGMQCYFRVYHVAIYRLRKNNVH